MEDQRRNMDSPKEEVTEANGKSLNPGQLTIVLIRSVGKIRSFTISGKIVLWTSIFILAYILVSVYIFNRFFELRYVNNIQSEKLEGLEKTLNQNEKELLRIKQYAEGLEEYYNNYNRAQKERETSLAIDMDESIKTVDQEVGNPVAKSEEQDESLKIVNIEDISIMKDDSDMTVDFKLVNARSEDDAAEGYIHIIVMDNKMDYPREWNDDRIKLQNGIPVDFSKGQLFSIQRYRPYHRQFNMNSNSELPATIKILVYNRSGELILNKELKAGNAS